MTQTNDINKVLEEGFKKARKLVYGKIESCLYDIADVLLLDAINNWDTTGKNLTGNTRTSIIAGLYMFGTLTDIIYPAVGLKKPIRVKMVKEEVFNGIDYDGIERYWDKALIDTDGGYGEPWAIHYLSSYSFPKDDCGLVFTSGTEYSEFIWKAYHYDVLVGTHRKGKGLAALEWKKIKL